ncbi:hypothetical protein G6F42_010473 [Rhizopus arrhizus]|nr:hypothetical protein G6F42_010473 [Rhizopus arrhizus]
MVETYVMWIITGTLKFRNLKFTYEKNDVNGLTVISRNPKEITPKSSKLGRVIDFKTCPVWTLHYYAEDTKELRICLSIGHTLLLASFLSPPYEITYIKPTSTAASWLQKALMKVC